MASDGVELFAETWLPAPRHGLRPPARLPSVLVMSPYTGYNRTTRTSQKIVAALVPRGYAVTQMHVRGTGESGGCLEFFSAREADDGARMVEWLATRSPWGDGTVGAIGLSYWATTALNTAARGDRALTKYLKAVVAAAPVTSSYDHVRNDGVHRFWVTNTTHNTGSMYGYSLLSGHSPTETLVTGEDPTPVVEALTDPRTLPEPAHVPQKGACVAETVAAETAPGSDYTTYFAARDLRPHAGSIRAATLMFHGHRDGAVPTIMQAGFFDRIRAPKAGVFGVFDHEFPDEHYSGLRPEWERADTFPMIVAWFDRYVRGRRDTGVESWPAAQVQGSDGHWRVERSWPRTGGPPGQLALSAGGILGAASPTGRSVVVDAVPFDDASPVAGPNQRVVFDSGPLKERLEIVGGPLLDTWVTVDRSDAHLAVALTAYGRDGEPLPDGRIVGARSLRHVAPFRHGGFAQETGAPAPVGVPFRVLIRLPVIDLVVPRGGRITISIAGSQTTGPGVEGTAGLPVSVFEYPTEPSFSGATVTVHHDCAHPTALRFLLPSQTAVVLDVEERGRVFPDRSVPPSLPDSDGGHARRSVCGVAAVDPYALTG
ncbi:MAG TPA: CocE/NonD family hydrolase [Mycobacteriales bacterium]|nr:CocE/NonD family hydrolase [Mycobacteriales bacterium]